MKKIFSLLFVVVTIASFSLLPSCKKTQHPTNPTPANYRVLGYTKVVNWKYPADNYAFSYDDKNRVKQIISSTNESSSVVVGQVGKRAVFSYSNDTIYKVVTNIRTADTLEVDTFIHNSSGQIITAYLPGKYINYEYYGKLLVRIKDSYYSGTTTVSSTRTYTTDNKDFLSLAHDGKLTAEFSNSLTTPLHIVWGTASDGATTEHTSDSYIDILTNYSWGQASVVSTDDIGHIDNGYFAGVIWPKESYGVFPDKNNRPGDYMQLGSFTMYGVNIFEAAHLTKSITNLDATTNITYDIDADSKIKTTTAVINDRLANTYTEIYNIQYETY